jgi:hypothetical protein
MRGHSCAIAASALALLTSSSASAADGLRPRAVIVWSDVPCMTVVERDVDPVLHLEYGISFEDLGHTADEVATGRRQQMIGFCRQHSPQSPLPTWLSQADVDDAASIPLIDPADIPPEGILDLAAAWTDCTTRIVPDEQRRPITEAAAAEGVAWDTTGLARGGWAIEGYTWDPPFNLWAPRPGVVAVFDDAAATDNPPVAAISTGELSIYADDIAMIEGCVVATPGTTLSAAWAQTVPGDEQVWTPFVTDEPVEGSAFAIAFAPPEAIVGSNANIRVEFVDAVGQSYVAYMREAIAVLPGSGGGCASSGGGGFLGDPGCNDTSTTDPVVDTTGDPPATTETSAEAPSASGDPQGCAGCSSTPATTCGILVPVLAAVRRRRRP